VLVLVAYHYFLNIERHPCWRIEGLEQRRTLFCGPIYKREIFIPAILIEHHHKVPNIDSTVALSSSAGMLITGGNWCKRIRREKSSGSMAGSTSSGQYVFVKTKMPAGGRRQCFETSNELGIAAHWGKLLRNLLNCSFDLLVFGSSTESSNRLLKN